MARPTGRRAWWRSSRRRVGRRPPIWTPLVVWAAFIATLAVSLGLAVVQARTFVRDGFSDQVGATSEWVTDFVADIQDRGQVRAEQQLTGRIVPLGKVRDVVTELGLSSGAVFDESGHYLAGLEMVEHPEIVGTDFTGTLEHLRLALLTGEPVVTQATPSPTLGQPAVGVAVPFSTTFGTRVLTGAIVLQEGAFSQLLTDVRQQSWSDLEGAGFDLLDREGFVIATTRGTLSDEISRLSQFWPPLARAMLTEQSGSFVDDQPIVFDVAPVGSTGWRLVATAPAQSVYARTGKMATGIALTVSAVAALGLVAATVLMSSNRRRRAAEAKAERLNLELQSRVERRTSDLQQANESLEAALTVARSAERSAANLADVVQAAGDAIISQDVDGNITSWNPAAERLFGYAAQDIIGRHVSLLAPPDDTDDVAKLIDRARRGERSEMCHTVRRSEVGTLLQVEVIVTPMLTSDGRVDGVVCVHRDLTRQRAVEARERRAQRMFASVFRSSGAAQGITDMAGRFVKVNEALCRLLGYSEAELLQMTAGELTHQEDRAATRAYLGRMGAGIENDVTVQKRYLHRDGHHVVTLATLTAVAEDDEGPPTHVVGMLQDITSSTAATQRLAEREALLAAATSSSANLSTLYEPSGRCVFAAGTALDGTGLAADDLHGLFFFENLGENHEALAGFRRALAGEAVDLTLHLGGRTFDTRLRPVTSHDGVTHIAAALTDVTEQERARQELVQVNEDLRHAIAVRDHILDATTHELRTPLTPIIGMLEFLDHRWDDLGPEDLRRHFDLVERNARRLAALVEDLLFATRLRTGEVTARPQAIDLLPRVQRMLALWNETTDARVDIEPDDLQVWCDPEHLDQALACLLSNAVKYGAAPYRIEIATLGRDQTAIRIHDRGPGVADALIEHLFDPFAQGSVGDRRTASGLGLGLPIARAVTLANGGDLSHAHQPGGGSTFTVVLPTSPAPDGPDTAAVMAVAT